MDQVTKNITNLRKKFCEFPPDVCGCVSGNDAESQQMKKTKFYFQQWQIMWNVVGYKQKNYYKDFLRQWTLRLLSYQQ